MTTMKEICFVEKNNLARIHLKKKYDLFINHASAGAQLYLIVIFTSLFIVFLVLH